MNVIKRIITALLFVSAALLFSACGNNIIGDISGGSDADAVFCIIQDTTVSPVDDDIIGLININGKSFDSASELEFSVPEGTAAITLTGDDSILRSNPVESNTSVLLTAKNSEGSFVIKVVVFAEYTSDDFISDGNLIIPYGVSDVGTSYRGSEIKYARVPSTMEVIGENTFSSCKALEKVELPSSLQGIAPFAFKDCSSLSEIEIPDGVTKIENSAFRHCSGLKRVSLNDNITSIEQFAFYGCSSLEEIEFSSALKSIAQNAFQFCSSLKSAVIPDGIERIDKWTFAGCSSIETIDLPDTLISIGERAFMDCSMVSELIIPSSVKSLGTDVFNGCGNVSVLSIPVTIEIEKGMFSGVNRLSEVHLTGSGNGVNYTTSNYIYTPWFMSRNNPIKVIIEEGVESIGDYTFVRCTGLYELVLPGTLKSIMHGAFRKCINLETLQLPESMLRIDDYAFSLCKNLKTVSFNEGIKVIGIQAFSYNETLEEISLPDSVSYIAPLAFTGCNSVKEITLGTGPDSQLKVIGESAFSGFLFNCKSVSIHSNAITAIGRQAFGYYTSPFGQNLFARLAEGAVIKTSKAARNLLLADYNYHGETCRVVNLAAE